MYKIISLPLFSVVTPVLNPGECLVNNMTSVIGQTYNTEHIIEDALSNDGTVELAIPLLRKIDRIFSRPDSGLYDGMNKGITSSTGEYIAILNADDWFADEYVLSKVARCFQETGADCVFGDIQIIERGNPFKLLRRSVAPASLDRMILAGRLPSHPAFFVRRKVYESVGLYNWQKYPNAADIDFIARVLTNHTFVHLPEILTNVTWGGYSNLNVKHVLHGHLELLQAWRNNGLPIGSKFLIKRMMHLAGALSLQARPLQPIIHRLWEYLVKKL